jgi:hypothetical protein
MSARPLVGPEKLASAARTLLALCRCHLPCCAGGQNDRQRKESPADDVQTRLYYAPVLTTKNKVGGISEPTRYICAWLPIQAQAGIAYARSGQCALHENLRCPCADARSRGGASAGRHLRRYSSREFARLLVVPLVSRADRLAVAKLHLASGGELLLAAQVFLARHEAL